MNARLLTPELRARLKAPLGDLFTGDEPTAARAAWALVLQGTPAKVIIVGDRVAADSATLGVEADLYIVDGRVMRRTVTVEHPAVERVLDIENPAGTLTSSAVNAVRRALAGREKARIDVKGEEDLLTLPAILEAPLGSFVVYGQPGEGVVVVEVTEAKKKEIRQMVESMPCDAWTAPERHH